MKVITETKEDINSVTLKRGMKGDYGWDIKVYSEDMVVILDKIKYTDERLREDYI